MNISDKITNEMLIVTV